MQYEEEDIYLFNPDYVMRNDTHRVVLFSGSQSNCLGAPNWESFLHPVHARIFSFFTFNRPLQVTMALLGGYLERDESSIRKIVFPYIENPRPVYTKYKDTKVRIPQNVIINRNRITGNVAFTELDPGVFNCRGIDLTTPRTYMGPQILTFMLNNTCISNCIYCYADTKTKVPERISTKRILELIEEAATLPVRFINLMGGEILLHPDWTVILKKLVDLRLSPEYISSKYPLNGDIIRSLQKTGFGNPVQLSLDACSPDVLQKTLSVKSGYPSKVLQGIKMMDNSGLKYRINSVLTTGNTKKEVIRELFCFISSLKNITDWRITPAVNSNWIEYEQFKKIKPDKTEIEALYEFIEIEIKPHSKIPIFFNRPVINR